MIDTVILLALLAVSLVIALKLLTANRFRLVKVRYAVTLKNGEGEFVGTLIERHWEKLTFADVVVPPKANNEAPQNIPGFLHVERTNVAYLQELTDDPV